MKAFKNPLPYAVFAFFILCYALNPTSPIYTHAFDDPDDAMRLFQVSSWMQGQSWFDTSVPRLSPGGDTIIHWSRLIDLPIAALAWPFVPSFGVVNATRVASYIVPVLWLGALLVLLSALARPLLGRKGAGWAGVFLLFSPLTLNLFAPGRVDHHGAQVVLAAVAYLCLMRIASVRRGDFYALAAAAAVSCALWIGTEAVPWIVLFIGCLGYAAARFGEPYARRGAVFGGAFAVLTTALVPLTLPPEAWGKWALSWFSPAFAIFAGLIAAVMIGARKAAQGQDVRGRFAAYAKFALVAAAVFVFLVPSVRQGPFADYNPFDATIALNSIGEAQPLIDRLTFDRQSGASMISALVGFMTLIWVPLLGLAAAFMFAVRGGGVGRRLWLVHALFLGVLTLLTLFVQVRIGRFAQLFALVPMAGLWLYVRRKLAERLTGRRLFWAEIAAFFLLAAGPVWIVPQALAKKPLFPDMALFPAARAPANCRTGDLIMELNDPDGLGREPHVIMNDSNVGPELLLKTRHSVISANYNVSGNLDAFAFFSSRLDIDARQIAQYYKADLVVFCRNLSPLYLGDSFFSLQKSEIETGADGKLHLVSKEKEPPFIYRVSRGQIPAWLKPIEIQGTSDYLLFKIQEPEPKKP